MAAIGPVGFGDAVHGDVVADRDVLPDVADEEVAGTPRSGPGPTAMSSQSVLVAPSMVYVRDQ